MTQTHQDYLITQATLYMSHKGSKEHNSDPQTQRAQSATVLKHQATTSTNKITSIHLPKKEAKSTCIFQQGRLSLDMHPGYRRMHVSRDAEEVPEFLKADFPELELLTHLEFT